MSAIAGTLARMAGDWYLDPELTRRWEVAESAHAAYRDAPADPDLMTECIAADAAYGELFQRLRAEWYADEALKSGLGFRHFVTAKVRA